MSNYTQTTNFATKDALASGNPLKIVKGTEINTEFANIATAVATKADTASPTFTGTVTIPTLAVTTTTFSSNPTLSGGTANGVGYLNGSNVLTTGSALVFDGTNLGVGVTPSAWSSSWRAIQVAGISGNSGGSLYTNAGSTTGQIGVAQNWYWNGTNNLYLTTAAASDYYQYAGTHVWRNAPSGTAGNSVTFAQVMSITATGAVSFGSTGTNTGTSGQLLSSQGSGTNPTWVAQSSIAAGSALIRSATAQASTSGTSIDFTSIPSDAKRITVMFSGVSTNGSSNVQIQIGDSGGVETSGYVGSASTITSGAVGQSALSAGFQDRLTGSAATVRYATVVLTLLDTTTTWTCTGMWSNSNSAGETSFVCGSKVLSPGPLDRIRITTINGTDTFDAGSINILYE